MINNDALILEHVTPWMITYDLGGRWHSIDLSNTEAAEVLRTGKVDDKDIAELAMLRVSDPDRDEIGAVVYVYDFTLSRKGLPAWRLVYEPAD